MHLVHQTWVDPRLTQHNRGTVSRIQFEAELQQFRRQVNNTLFVAFANGEQRAPLFFHRGAAAELRFSERFGKSTAHAHHFPGRAHFWP